MARLACQFRVPQPNRVWSGDLTYVWILEGWLYLASATGSVLACRHRLGDGHALDRRVNRAGPPHDAHHAWHHGQYEPQRQLLA